MTIDRAAPRRAGAADFRTLSALLGRAFVDDPGWAWIYPEPDRPRRLETMFNSLLAAAHRRRAVVLCDEARRGAAIWQRSESRDLGRRGNFAMVVAMARGGANLRRCGVLARALESCHPPEPHWYLATLGTDPAHEGAGVASSLVRHHLDDPASTGEASYLEVLTEANLAFYARFGFEVCGEIDVPSDGPHVWQMWREAP